MKKHYCLYCNDDKGRFDMTKTGKMVESAGHFFHKPEYRCRKCGNVVNHLSKDIVREAIEQSRRVKGIQRHMNFIESNVVDDKENIKTIIKQLNNITFEVFRDNQPEVTKNDIPDSL